MTEKGFVYVIRAVGTRRIKIGFTTQPKERLASLQTGSPFPLEMISCRPGDRGDERGDMRELPRVDRADDMPGVWKSDRIM